jgi:hypothetical protein
MRNILFSGLLLLGIQAMGDVNDSYFRSIMVPRIEAERKIASTTKTNDTSLFSVIFGLLLFTGIGGLIIFRTGDTTGSETITTVQTTKGTEKQSEG